MRNKLKKCSKCGELKSLDDFCKHKAKHDGLNSRCKECSNNVFKSWASRNHVKHIEKKRLWRTSNLQQDKSNKLQWREYNGDKIRSYNSKRRSLKQNAVSQLHNPKIEQCFYKMARMLKEETGNDYHLDHILPLNKGGVHHHCNLQIIEAKKNLEKNISLVYQDAWLMSFIDLPDVVLDMIDEYRLTEAFKEIEDISIEPFKCFSC